MPFDKTDVPPLVLLCQAPNLEPSVKIQSEAKTPEPIGSMYGIYANIWGILMVNVTIYSIYGSYGEVNSQQKRCPSASS